MTEVSKKVLYWAPRVSCIAFALFLSLFAMDVFGEGLGFWRTLFALFMHLIPTFVVLLILALAWRWNGLARPVFRAQHWCSSSTCPGICRRKAGRARRSLSPGPSSSSPRCSW